MDSSCSPFLPMEEAERTLVNHWKVTIRKGLAFETLPYVEHLDEIAF